MKIKFLPLALMFTAALFFSCGQRPVIEEPEAEPVYHFPDPERVLFYRDGTTVFETKIPAAAIINNSFILPPQVDKNSFTIHQNSSRIFSYTLEDAQLLIQLLEQDPKNPEIPLINRDNVLLVTVPELSQDSPLVVKFGIGKSGMTWRLVLDMEATDGNTLDCNLLASIETHSDLAGGLETIFAKRPEIILLPSANIFLEGHETVFNLGTPLIKSNKTTFMKLEGGQSTYRLVYRWDANERERPLAYLYCSNPFVSSINGVKGYLNSNGLNINDYSLRLIPGRQFMLFVGDQPLLSTFKSVRTQEFPDRKNLPFTHTLEYKVTSQLAERAELEISVPVTYGKVHRTQYHFRRQPDERPGDQMIWNYTLAPGASANLEFSFDAETKDNPLYSRFDYSDGGR